MQHSSAGPESTLKHASILIGIAVASPALAQQGAPPPQPVFQPPPPPIRQQRNTARDGQPAPPRQDYRWLAFASAVADTGDQIEDPVTGFGNDLLWDPPA